MASLGTPRGIRWVHPVTEGSFTAFGRERLLLGRDDDCDVVLVGEEASRHHAEIVVAGPLVVVRDLGSTNGVFLNGKRITQEPLEDGDVIRFGGTIGILTQETSQTATFSEIAPGFLGGPVTWPIADLAKRAAPSTLSIIIQGETGTGKEVLARTIHTWSERHGPFVAVNCAALPETLAEGELFGYRKGAFTGAEKASLGHFRSAHGGTLLLDEIVDMPLALQSKVLRVLEQREVVPLGESTPQFVDVRIIAAAQTSLQDAVASRRFRADLMARLNGLTIVLPPLRDRLQEIPFLFTRLLNQHAGSTAPTLDARLAEELCLYPWPFNVREMDLLVRRLLTLHPGASVLKRSLLPAEMLAATSARPGTTSGALKEDVLDASADSRDERDASALAAALRTFGGNVARAAAVVGISRQRAYRLVEEKGIDLEKLRSDTDERRSR